jgi:glycolate oxidase FAD binding subunit
MSEPPADAVESMEIAPGVAAHQVMTPGTAEEISGLLEIATTESSSVVPFGGARSVVTGHAVGPFDIGLDLRQITGILSYEPADLVLSVRAGTTLGEIQEELGHHNQELPLDVPNPASTTIGGLVATGFAGPRRLRSGSLRDLLIGCEFVRGDGLLAKAGGMVVKNVSGFEIPRFLHGSWGALAVITSVNLKVAPRPRADRTVLAAMPGMAEAVGASRAMLDADASIDACTLSQGPGGVTLAVRALGRSAAVMETLNTTGHLAGNHEILGDDESRTFWQSQVERFAERPDAISLAASTRPRNMADLVDSVQDGMSGCQSLEMLVSPGTGSVRLRWTMDADAAGWIEAAARSVTDAGGAYVLECAPASIRDVVDPWGPEPEGIGIMQAVKQQFDPGNVLNRGRLLI